MSWVSRGCRDEVVGPVAAAVVVVVVAVIYPGT